jgi:GTPase SAR1 family protein
MTKSTVVFLVGPPASGKTTLVHALFSLYGTSYITEKPKWTFSDEGPLCAAGHYLGHPFDGADTVPYNGAKDAFEYWRDFSNHSVTILDGDRFSCTKWKQAFSEHVERTICIFIAATSHLLEERREIRQRETGKVQNPTWVKGRATKARNFFNSFDGDKRFVLNAHDRTEDKVNQFLTIVAFP